MKRLARLALPRRALGVLRGLAVAALAAAFWVPAAQRTGGLFPAPLDDVYIYFQIARSTSEGCFLCYGDAAGASTGATSPVYALALAVLALVARSPTAMGWAVAALTLALLVDAGRSLAHVARRRLGVALVAPLLPFTLPILAWSLLSGMESAWIAALMARAVRLTDDAQRATGPRLARRQLEAGVVFALLAVGRPELVPMALAFVVSVAHASGDAPLHRTLTRAGLPTVAALGAHALFLVVASGDTVAAGAARKVVLYDPYATATDRALVFVTNLVRLTVEGFSLAWGGVALGLTVALALLGLTTPRSRRLALPLLLGALASLLLVCWNRTAPFQHLRYLAPTYLGLLFAAGVGLARIARLRSRAARACGLGAACLAGALTLGALGVETSHFARAARNIHDQQIAMGRALEADPTVQRVFVGDAGAIAYFSDKPTLDGLGLGGYRGLPFARASVLGEGAVAELIERLPAEERPDTLAVYTSWWPGIAATFGTKRDAIEIEDNVICADPVKTRYDADWSSLEPGPAENALDLADLPSEEEHGTRFDGPTEPRVGLVLARDEEGARRFDGTRVLDEGDALAFDLPAGDVAALELRYTARARGAARVVVDGREIAALDIPADVAEAWRATRAELPAGARRARVEILAGSLELAKIVFLR